MSIDIPKKSIIDEIAYDLFLNKYPDKKKHITINIFMLSYYRYNFQTEFYIFAKIKLRKRKLNNLL